MSLNQNDHFRHEISGRFARESVAYCLILPEHGLMGHWYTWVNAEGLGGRAFVLHGTGPEPIFFDHKEGFEVGEMDFDNWSLDGAHLAVGDSLMAAEASFHSEDLTVEFTFEGMHQPFDYDSNSSGTPHYLADNRYEQSGRIRGQMTWQGTTYKFDGPGHRDHSWGTRDWNSIHHYKWIAAAGEDCSVNLMWTLAEGEVDINGYVYQDNKMLPIVDADIVTEFGEAFVQDALKANIVDAEGRRFELDLNQRYTLARWDVSPTFNFSDTMFTGVLGDAKVQAYVEYTWPRAYLDHLLERSEERSVTTS